MNTTLKLGTSILLACLLVPVATAMEAPKKYFFINGNFIEADEVRGLEGDGSGFDIGFGRQLSDHLYGEVRGFGVMFEKTAAGADIYTNAGAALDLHYLFGERGNFSAFLLGGVGFAFNDVDNDDLDDGGFQGTAGLGILSRGLTSVGVRLRLEGRAIYEDYLDGITDYRVGLGFEIPLDPAEVVVREVVVEKPVAAAPPPQSEAYPPRPIDTDGDGVLDNFDQCAGTLPGARVDRAGCAVKDQNIRLEGVRFETNSDRLTPDSSDILDRAAEALQGQPGLRVLIAGHADSSGNRGRNQVLSQLRAQAVMRYLRDKGVASTRMAAIGYGDSRPLASNDTPQGRALNRRVEFQIEK